MTGPLVVVGSGIGGIRAVESARAAGYQGHIILVGDEIHSPYERPPLSKQVLTGTYENRIVFPRDESDLSQLRADLRLGVKATSLDTSTSTLGLSDGSTLQYGQLVIATGSRARKLPFEHPLGVHTIRTLDDSIAIAAELANRPRVAVVGAGFIGLEVASTARAMECQVTLIESGRVPLVRALGQSMGVHAAALHESRGVNVLTGGRVLGFTAEDNRVTGIVLDDQVLPVDLVVVGIGAIPNSEWLAGSGLEIGDGILCDDHGRAQGAEGVFAVGDVAAWWDSRRGKHIRYEHWTSAGEQALHVGKLIAGQTVDAHLPVPYFWSDQHGIKIQMAGRPAESDELSILSGTLSSGKFLAAYSDVTGALTAVLSFGAAREFARVRVLLSRDGTLADATTAVAASARPAAVRT